MDSNIVIIDGYIVVIKPASPFYPAVMECMANRPIAPAGYDYRLKEDLTWELYELPPEPEEEATSEDYEAALNRLGVET